MAFRRHRHIHIKEEERVLTTKQACATCGQQLQLGDKVLRYMLPKAGRQPCSICGSTPRRSKYFHIACRPPDAAKAMGYDPTGQGHAQQPKIVYQKQAVCPHGIDPASCSACARVRNQPAVAPPRPPTWQEELVAAVAATERAFALRLRQRNIEKTPEVAKAYETLSKVKARITGGTTTGEQEVSIIVALKRVIELGFKNL